MCRIEVRCADSQSFPSVSEPSARSASYVFFKLSSVGTYHAFWPIAYRWNACKRPDARLSVLPPLHVSTGLYYRSVRTIFVLLHLNKLRCCAPILSFSHSASRPHIFFTACDISVLACTTYSTQRWLKSNHDAECRSSMVSRGPFWGPSFELGDRGEEYGLTTVALASCRKRVRVR